MNISHVISSPGRPLFLRPLYSLEIFLCWNYNDLILLCITLCKLADQWERNVHWQSITWRPHKSSSLHHNLFEDCMPWNSWSTCWAFHYLPWQNSNSPIRVLCCTILRLHVTTYDRQHLTIFNIIHMVCHCRPILQALHMVKIIHKCSMSPPNNKCFTKIHTTAMKVYTHFENKNLVY